MCLLIPLLTGIVLLSTAYAAIAEKPLAILFNGNSFNPQMLGGLLAAPATAAANTEAASRTVEDGGTGLHPALMAGWNEWTAEQGVWEVGVPTSGPGAAHSGSNCVATVLGGELPAKH